ncbi:MAG: AAA family ATPase [Caldilineaceae bacterium]|nr:AAA family ATPase [Caldilineaceae bacterium]
MHLVIIFGPPAVGKMTVGAELAKLTGFKLFHNHMTIELVLNFFPYGHPQFNKLVSEFRRRIFEEVAASDLPGLIFTYVWALDHPSDKDEIDRYCDIFCARGADIRFVELEAPVEERLKRNQGEDRLAQKPSKRNVIQSEQNLLESGQQYKLNSTGDFFYPDKHIKIDNTTLSPAKTAALIVKAFALPAL